MFSFFDFVSARPCLKHRHSSAGKAGVGLEQYKNLAKTLSLKIVIALPPQDALSLREQNAKLALGVSGFGLWARDPEFLSPRTFFRFWDGLVEIPSRRNSSK